MNFSFAGIRTEEQKTVAKGAKTLDKHCKLQHYWHSTIARKGAQAPYAENSPKDSYLNQNGRCKKDILCEKKGKSNINCKNEEFT